MNPSRLFFDERLALGSTCVYCAGQGATVEHVPSKVFLDKPLPANLPSAVSCKECNRGFSLDEQYVACLIDCAITGDVEPGPNSREKVAKTLRKRPRLQARLRAARQRDLFGGVFWLPEHRRVHNVMLKLARSHVALELSMWVSDEPTTFLVKPLDCLSNPVRWDFERGPECESNFTSIQPEVGTRAFIRELNAWPALNPWVVVQKERYRYRVNQNGDNIEARIVLSEYLACFTAWPESD